MIVKCLGGCNCEFNVNNISEIANPSTNQEHMKHYGHGVITRESMKQLEKTLQIAKELSKLND